MQILEIGRRIDKTAVDADLKVAVRAGGPAGGTDVANGRALGHALAGGAAELAHVGIERRGAVAVADDDIVAVRGAVGFAKLHYCHPTLSVYTTCMAMRKNGPKIDTKKMTAPGWEMFWAVTVQIPMTLKPINIQRP